MSYADYPPKKRPQPCDCGEVTPYGRRVIMVITAPSGQCCVFGATTDGPHGNDGDPGYAVRGKAVRAFMEQHKNDR